MCIRVSLLLWSLTNAMQAIYTPRLGWFSILGFFTGAAAQNVHRAIKIHSSVGRRSNIILKHTLFHIIVLPNVLGYRVHLTTNGLVYFHNICGYLGPQPNTKLLQLLYYFHIICYETRFNHSTCCTWPTMMHKSYSIDPI